MGEIDTEAIARKVALRTRWRWYRRLTLEDALQGARLGMMRCPAGSSAGLLAVAAWRGIVDEMDYARPIGEFRRGRGRLERVELPAGLGCGSAERASAVRRAVDALPADLRAYIVARFWGGAHDRRQWRLFARARRILARTLPAACLLGALATTAPGITLSLPDSAATYPGRGKAALTYPVTCYFCPGPGLYTSHWWDSGAPGGGAWRAGFGPGLYEIRRITFWGWPCAPYSRWTIGSGTYAGCLVFTAPGPGVYRIAPARRSGGGGRTW